MTFGDRAAGVADAARRAEPNPLSFRANTLFHSEPAPRVIPRRHLLSFRAEGEASRPPAMPRSLPRHDAGLGMTEPAATPMRKHAGVSRDWERSINRESAGGEARKPPRDSKRWLRRAFDSLRIVPGRASRERPACDERLASS
ncbi:MAG: hypothetical protein OHK0044_24570 [Burkholderiaceae bacterium]